MKTEQEIKERIIELEAEKDFWRLEVNKINQWSSEGYADYCRDNAAQYAAQITILRWVLDLPLIPLEAPISQ